MTRLARIQGGVGSEVGRSSSVRSRQTHPLGNLSAQQRPHWSNFPNTGFGTNVGVSAKRKVPVSPSSSRDRDAVGIGKHLACSWVIRSTVFQCAILRQLLLHNCRSSGTSQRPAPKEGHWRSLCLVLGFCCSLSTFVRSCYGQRSPV
jgi:hypothetical protein